MTVSMPRGRRLQLCRLSFLVSRLSSLVSRLTPRPFVLLFAPNSEPADCLEQQQRHPSSILINSKQRLQLAASLLPSPASPQSGKRNCAEQTLQGVGGRPGSRAAWKLKYLPNR